ncbi:MAG: hypothetical protein ACI4GD_00560 [Lachnospiraceae bacterium]
MKVYLNNVDITKYVSTLTWQGTATQVSRTADIVLASNPYDKTFKSPEIVNGDIIKFTEGSETYVGVCTGMQKTGEIGTITYNTKDFMHYLLRGSYSKKFKNKTPEAIAKKICTDIGVPVGNLSATKIHLAKLTCDGVAPYNGIVKAYNRASKKCENYYMPVMDGKKLCVKLKWEECGVQLEDTMTSTEYTENTESVVNQVVIYTEKGDKAGVVKNQKSISKYGLYQETYTKEKGVNAKTAANHMLHGITKEAKVSDVIGDVRAKAGYAIRIKDKATGLTGKYYITSDTHTWENGRHTMSLDLTFEKEREAL